MISTIIILSLAWICDTNGGIIHNCQDFNLEALQSLDVNCTRDCLGTFCQSKNFTLGLKIEPCNWTLWVNEDLLPYFANLSFGNNSVTKNEFLSQFEERILLCGRKRSKRDTTTSATSRIGQECQLGKLTNCGTSSTCVNTVNRNGKGLCECVNGFINLGGVCVKSQDIVGTSSSHSTSSTSLTIILIMMMIATSVGLFYGNRKYGLFAKIVARLCPINRRDDNIFPLARE